MITTAFSTNDHSRSHAQDRAKRPRQKHHDLLCMALMALTLMPVIATAEPLVTLPAPAFELPALPPVSGTWTVMVGVGGEYKPDFEGANRSMLSPVPIFSIRRAGSAEQFRSPRDGASIALIDFGDLRAGPVGKFVASRKANNFTELNGLGDIGATVELGGFLEYFPVDWFRTRVETRQGFGGHHGVVADFSADAIVPIIQGVTFSAGPRFTWEAPRQPRHISASMPFRRWLRGCRCSTPRAGRTRSAPAHSCPIGSIRNGRFTPMSSTSA